MRLPSAYQEVEYIESSGTQYIDTGLKITNATSIKAKTHLYYSTLPTNERDWLGTLDTNSGFWFGNNSSGYPCIYSRQIGYGCVQSSKPQDQEIECFISSGSGGYHTMNGTKVTTSTNSTLTGAENIVIFNNDLSESGRLISCRMYYLKIDINGTTVRNYTPCYRKSDNEIGMYDTVNNTFYTNSGTGTFTKGANVEYPPEYKLHGAIQTFHRERPYEWKPGANTIAYYPLTSETTVNDMSGNGNNLTNSNVLFGEYDGVDCAYLNGNAYLTVPDIVNNTSEWTMSFYIKPSTTTGAIFSKQWDGNNTSLIGMGFYTNSGGTKTSGTSYYIYGKTYNAGGNAVSNNEALSTSDWSNVILVGSSSSMEIYVNGVLKNTGSGNYSFPNWDSYTAERIGSRLGDGSEKGKLTGYMGSFIFENKKWTAQDVANYYNRSKDNYESTPHIPVYDNLLETKDASNWITSSVNYNRYLGAQFDYVSPITTSYKIVIERVGGALVAVSPTSQSDSSQYSTSDEGIISVDSGGHPPFYTYFPPSSTGGYIAYLYGDSAA